MLKPLLQIKGSGNFTYKNCWVGYVMGEPVLVETDLNWDEFDRLCEGRYGLDEIERYEVCGRFK